MGLNFYYQQFRNKREQLMPNLVSWLSPLYVFLFKCPERAWKEDKQSLLARKEGSLGHELGCFLQKDNLQLMPCLETHDVYHVILGYPTTVQGEAELLFFILGNGKRTAFTLASVSLALILMPEWWGLYWSSFCKGRKTRSFVNENLQNWLDKPLEKIQKQILDKPDFSPSFSLLPQKNICNSN